MKVGDLVQYIGEDADQPPLLGLGIVMGFDHDKDPIKLHLNYIDREIDLGFYSRNRVINEESSMSVLG